MSLARPVELVVPLRGKMVAMDNWKVHLLVLSAVAGICCSVFFQNSMRVREIFFVFGERASKGEAWVHGTFMTLLNRRF